MESSRERMKKGEMRKGSPEISITDLICTFNCKPFCRKTLNNVPGVKVRSLVAFVRHLATKTFARKKEVLNNIRA